MACVFWIRRLRCVCRVSTFVTNLCSITPSLLGRRTSLMGSTPALECHLDRVCLRTLSKSWIKDSGAMFAGFCISLILGSKAHQTPSQTSSDVLAGKPADFLQKRKTSHCVQPWRRLCRNMNHWDFLCFAASTSNPPGCSSDKNWHPQSMHQDISGLC